MIREIYVLIFALLCLGFGLLFIRVRWLQTARRLLQRSRQELDRASGQRLLEKRRQILNLQRKLSFWHRVDQELYYSGIKRKIPFLTAELWVALHLSVVSLMGIIVWSLAGWWKMLQCVWGFLAAEAVFMFAAKAWNFRRVNSNLIKFLDFLGNYSITAGEITGIFIQISKYVEEPLKTVLEECSYEAQTTGDSGMALLTMAEKIEHPKFKELVRNMEISLRYCADFSLLVSNSRRMMREYLRMRQERRSLLREATVNMILLLVMSFVSLLVADGLLNTSIWNILTNTVPGQIALGIMGVILVLFVRKLAERR